MVHSIRTNLAIPIAIGYVLGIYVLYSIQIFDHY